MEKGWVKIQRKMVDHWVFSEPELVLFWIRLLLDANHKEKKKIFNGTLITVKRGQLIFGLNSFSSKTGISICKIRRYLKLLKSDSMISIVKHAKYSIITITSYGDYQDDNSLNDKQITSKRQSNDNQMTTPKECKKEKNDKNEYIYQQIADAWNVNFQELPNVLKVSQKRKSHLRATINEFSKSHGLDKVENWTALFDYIKKSDFLMGRSSNWCIDFDFLINKNNLLKIIEGKYDNA